jgi:molybdate transport system permease protein
MTAITSAEWTALLLSAKVALGAVAVVALPGIVLGWLLARKNFHGKLLVELLVYAPLVMPPVVTGYLLLLLCGRNGPVGGWLDRTFGWHLVFTWQGAALASAIMALPLMVRAVRLAIELVDRRLEEAASVLGYSPWRVFRQITLPLARSGILAGLLLAFARSLGEFGATITFAGNIQGVTQTLPLAIYSALQAPGGEAAAARLSILSLLLSLTALGFSEWLARRTKAERPSHASRG